MLNEMFVFTRATGQQRGQILQNKRKTKKNWDQEKLANKINEELKAMGNCDPAMKPVSKKQISDWETGRIKTIPDQVLDAWIRILDINPNKDFMVMEMKATISVGALDYTQFREFTNLLVYTYDHLGEGWLSCDREYTRNIKNDMREILERYLSDRDKAGIKQDKADS